MSQIDNVVTVDIIKGQAGVSRPGFGIPFLISYHSNFPEKYKEYTNLSQVSSDFASTSVEYLRAKALFDNTTKDNNGTRMKSPEKIYIGRLPSNTRINILKNEDGEYKLKVNSSEYSFVASSVSKADIAAGLSSLITAGTEPVTISYTATNEYFTIKADVFATDFSVEVIDKLKLQTTLPNQLSTLTFAGDLITDNVVNLKVVQNEIEWSMPAVTFITDHETTMGLIATALKTNTYILDATVSLTPFLIITITTIEGREILLKDILITAGISQTTATFAETYKFKNIVAKDYLNLLSFQDYYMVLYALDFYDNAEIVDLSDFLENWSYKKALFFNSNDVRVTEGISSGIAFDIKQKAIDRGKLASTIERTIGFYTKQLDNYIADGLIGANGPKTAGSITWAYQKSKLAIYDDYSGTTGTAETGYLISNNMNYYTRIAGFDIISPSKDGGEVIGGEYFDITRGADWLKANMELDVFEIFALSDKVPYTNRGVKTIVNAVYNRLNEGLANGFLSEDEDFLVTAPDVNTLTSAERESRSYGIIQATARFAGAIQHTHIQVNLSY